MERLCANRFAKTLSLHGIVMWKYWNSTATDDAYFTPTPEHTASEATPQERLSLEKLWVENARDSFEYLCEVVDRVQERGVACGAVGANESVDISSAVDKR
jgi:hypothetical protein